MGRTACTEPKCLYKGALYLLPLTVVKVLFGLPYVMYEAGLQKKFIITQPKYYTSVRGKNKYNHEYSSQCIRRFGTDFKWERPEYVSDIVATPACLLIQGRRKKCVWDGGRGLG
jgi:hypothetical protein